MVAALRFARAVETHIPTITTNDQQIEVKIYAPLPYGTNWEEIDPIQKSFKKGDAFYNMVERRYVNDTLYFTLQRNLNAHDAFDALSTIVNAIALGEKQQQAPIPKHHPTVSAADFMTVFPPSNPPAMVLSKHRWHHDRQASVWHYAFFLPTRWSLVRVPPPKGLVG